MSRLADILSFETAQKLQDLDYVLDQNFTKNLYALIEEGLENKDLNINQSLDISQLLNHGDFQRLNRNLSIFVKQVHVEAEKEGIRVLSGDHFIKVINMFCPGFFPFC